MTINEYLEQNGIDPIDDNTLMVIEDFIKGSQFALSMEQLEESKRHNAWVRNNLLSKREQLAGLAMTGLIQDYTSLSDMKADAYTMADALLGEDNDI